jgi:ribosomal protein L19E
LKKKLLDEVVELQKKLARPTRSAFIAELLEFAVKAWTSNPELSEAVQERLTREDVQKMIDEAIRKLEAKGQ